MQKLRLALVAGIAIAVILLVSGCSGAPVQHPGTPSATSTPVDKTSYIGHEIDPDGTIWTGTDSGGDLTSFTLHDSHTVAVSYAAHSFDYSGDTWAVVEGILSLHVFINHSDGTLDYTGTYDPATKSIVATAVTSLTGRKLTITLMEK